MKPAGSKSLGCGRTKRRLEREQEQGRRKPRAKTGDALVAQRISGTAGEKNKFLQSWVWKREGKPDKERFDKPYLHKMVVNGEERTLTIGQARFKEIGFASTVWDSSIVMAKYFERRPELVVEKRCLELGSGCGLVGIVLACLGAASVTLTDLDKNLPLLLTNCKQNQVLDKANVEELEWGSSVDSFRPPLDVLVATDVLYDSDVVELLVTTLRALSSLTSELYVAYGRNRWAEISFMALVELYFNKRKISSSELDEVYQCDDVDVYLLTLKHSVGS